MEELLEAVSEAVSAMVLYAVDADEKNTRVPDILPGAQVVKVTTDYLVDSSNKSAEFWLNFNQPEMRQKMLNTGEQIRTATSEILEAATILHIDAYSKPGKKLLLKGAKAVMEHMVVLLQQADLYEVTRIVRGCARVTNKKGVLLSLEPGESYFMTAAQELVTQTVELSKMVIKRIKEIDDFTLKRRFEEASNKLRADTDAFVKAMGQVMRSDPTARETANILSRALDESLQEIVTVAKLSAKSPFDLSMIEGIDLRDDEDLKDMALMAKYNIAALKHAIEIGDAKDANRILKALRRGLNDMVALNKALAKSCEDPMQKARYEAAAREAQRMLDEVVPSLADAVEELVLKPNSQLALKAVRGFIADLDKATDMMTQVASRPNATDIEALVQNMQQPLTHLIEAVRRGDVAMTGKMIDVIKGNVAQQLALADAIIHHTDDPALRAQLESSVMDAKRTLAEHIYNLTEASRMAALDPNNLKLMDAVQRHAEKLAGCCASLVNSCSTGTAEEVLLSHQSLVAERQRLTAAIQAGDRKEAVAAMRAVRKLLTDQLNAAKAIARTTTDPELKAQMEAVCTAAQKNIDSMLGRLAVLVDTAISDPSNLQALNEINEAFEQAELLSSKMVAACGADLLHSSHLALQERLNAMEEEVMRADAHAAVTALKAVLTETARQVDVGRMVANSFEEQDTERATRILGLAESLSSAAPALVAASKAALTSGNDITFADMHKNVAKIKDISATLVAAASMKPEDELLENAAILNAEMALLIKALDGGQLLEAEQVANILKKVSAQVKLSAVVANKSKDPKSKQGLLQASQVLSKLVGAMVAACKEALGNPNDPATQARLRTLLGDVMVANREAFLAFTRVEDDGLQAASEDIQAQLTTLERVLKEGSAAEVESALKSLEVLAAKQAFLAQAVAETIDDADRKKQLTSAIAELQKLAYAIAPVVREAKANPGNAAAQHKAAAMIDQLRAASHNIQLSATSSPEERMAERAVAIGSRLEDLELAVTKGNTSAAETALADVSASIAQQARAARAAAATATPGNKAVLLGSAVSLERVVAEIGPEVKAALAGDKIALQKLSANIANTRNAMAAIVANATQSNKLAADQAAHVASVIKSDLNKLSAAIATNPKVAGEAIAHTRIGALQQQVELARAYAAKVEDPTQKRMLVEALGDLGKLISGEFAVAVSVSQAKPSTASTTRVAASAEAATALLDTVLSTASLTPEDRVTALAVNATQEIAKLENAVTKKSEAEVVASLNSLKSTLADVAKATRLAAINTHNPTQKQKLFEAADALDGAHNQISYTAYAALSNPADAGAQKEFANACSEVKTALASAVAVSAALPEKQIAKTLIKFASEIDRLVASSEGDQPQAQTALANIKDPLRQQLQFARALAESVQDPEMKKAILAGLDHMRKAGPALVAAAEVAVKSPQDTIAREKLALAANEAKAALAEALAGALQTPEDRILDNSALVNRTMDNIVTAAATNNPVEVKSQLEAALALLSEQALLSRAVAVQSPQNAQTIKRDLEALEKTIPLLVKPATVVIANSSSATDKEKLGTAVNTAKEVHKSLAQHGKTRKLDKEKQQEALLRKEKEEQERLEHERKERLKKQEDEVAAAAAKLKERTEKLKVDGTVEGKLYGTAKGMAITMEKLSTAAASGNKKQMIEAARELAVLAQQHVEQAKLAVAKCTDPVLKEQILTSAQAAKNWSIQLKIIAAVKAASDEDSGSAKQQLVKCAKGLAKAVTLTVNSVEVSALRAK